MPMIDVYAPDSLFPVHSAPALGSELIRALLRAEGVASPGPFHLNNTAARYRTGSTVVRGALWSAATAAKH